MADDQFLPMSQSIQQIIKKSEISHPDSIDPTLRLSDDILHLIFSYLTSHENLNHVRLVSRNWRRNIPSYFVFNFDQPVFFRRKFPIAELRNKFMDWVHSSLETSRIKLSKAEKRILRVQLYDHENVHNIMRLMDGYNFHEVYLKFDNPIYQLPYIFQSTCLTLLHLSDCSLNHTQNFHGEENFDSLQELKLDGVRLTGRTLSKFISKCPNIRELSLVNCKLLRFIDLPQLDRLKKFYVVFFRCYSSIIGIQVIASNLQVFHFIYRSLNEFVVDMDIRACRMLREFHLDCFKFPVGLNHENFCSDFPHLETLLMGPCDTWKSINISSQSLRKLILFFTQMYDGWSPQIVFAPNLSSYEYVGTTFKPFLNPSHTSKLIETRIGLAYNVEEVNRNWFLKLRSHLREFRNNILLTICIHDDEMTSSFPDKLGKNLWSKLNERATTYPLHQIKHILLDMNKLIYSTLPHEYMMKYVIDNLFWMSHPDTLTLSMPYKFVALTNKVCKQLRSRKERNCCSGTIKKCWSHFLKDFEVQKKMTSELDKLDIVFKFTWQFIS